MEDMKGDMGGAAAVTGLMYALASRKAKVNAVGILGLVENMPGRRRPAAGRHRHIDGRQDHRGGDQHPDAEGRLVLADALW